MDSIRGIPLIRNKSSESTAGLTAESSSSYSAALRAVVIRNLRAGTLGTIAANHCQTWLSSASLKSEDIGNLTHGLVSAHWAEQTFERVLRILSLDTSISHTMTARESTATAICAWQRLLDLTHTWVFVNVELLSHHIQQQRAYET